jgi:hypothetical protein
MLTSGYATSIASISGSMPGVAITRLRFEASMCEALLMPTCFGVFVRKWVDPIQDSKVLNGCQTVLRRTRLLRVLVGPLLDKLNVVYMLPACETHNEVRPILR